MKHEMKLNNWPFERIKNGTKTIELRLNGEKNKFFQMILKYYAKRSYFKNKESFRWYFLLFKL